MNIPGLIAAINILLQSWAVVSRNYQRQTFLEHETHWLTNFTGISELKNGTPISTI